MSQIIPPVKKALQAMIDGFAELNPSINQEQAHELLTRMVTLLGHTGDFKTKLAELDQCLDDAPDFEPLYHYFFDLLMLSFIASDSAMMDENYLESEEWIKIEDETSDKGSELLNIYVYLQESFVQEIETGLQDYLQEFLLADDELYQDDFFIYEELIKSDSWMDASIQEVIQHADDIKSPELEEVFIPMMAFFNRQDSAEHIEAALRKDSAMAALNIALYRALKAFESGLKES